MAQTSANLLRDEELVDLIAATRGKGIFIGMESIHPLNLADVKKDFNKPGEYGAVLGRLAQRNVYAITFFRINIFIARMCFRGIRRTIYKLLHQGFFGGGLHAPASVIVTLQVMEPPQGS